MSNRIIVIWRCLIRKFHWSSIIIYLCMFKCHIKLKFNFMVLDFQWLLIVNRKICKMWEVCTCEKVITIDRVHTRKVQSYLMLFWNLFFISAIPFFDWENLARPNIIFVLENSNRLSAITRILFRRIRKAEFGLYVEGKS